MDGDGDGDGEGEGDVWQTLGFLSDRKPNSQILTEERQQDSVLGR